MFRITEIKYISNSYTPTYTSRSYVYYVVNPPTYIYPIRVYAYCVDTHGMLRTTPLQPSIALDRNKATRTRQGECKEEVGKKNCS